MAFAFDEYVLDPDRRELCRGAAPVKLEPQAFDLLAYLVQHRDRVIGRDELTQAIWSGRIVTDAALTTRINAVRRAIGDDGRAQRLIRTLSRKGIRFVGEVKETVAASEIAVANRLSGTKLREREPDFAERAGITVLPFVAISGNAEEQYLADSLTGDIVVALSRFRWYSVLAQTSPLAFRGTAFDVKRAGWELGTRYVLRGTVHRRTDRLRIAVYLIETLTGAHLWAEDFDGLLADGFALQDRIATTAAASIEAPLRIAEAARSNGLQDRDATPCGLHLQAHPIFSDGKESVVRSLRLLERALALDPDYAPALADAAFCLQVLDINNGGRDRRANSRKALALARKALHVSNDPEPVATAAFALAYFGEDIEDALALIDHALALNPAFTRGWYMSGMALLYAGQPERAVERFETAIQLNPRDRLGRRNNAGIGIAHFFTGQLDSAVSRLRLMVQEFPRWATPYAALAACYTHQGFSRDAKAVARRLTATDPSLAPNVIQFRDPKHRGLLTPGVRLAQGVRLAGRRR
jgi:TolB-like protein